MDDCCKVCWFGFYSGDGNYLCQKYAPRNVRGGETVHSQDALFPKMHPEGWCGEFDREPCNHDGSWCNNCEAVRGEEG